jgi:Domain of unknown function (DUF1843)
MAEDYQKPTQPIVPLYGVTIHHCIAGGDLAKMKELAAQAEKYLADNGDVGAALEVLKIEIAKAEARR